MTHHHSITVLGAGAWGSTLADLLARKGLSVRLWDHVPTVLEQLERERHPFGVPELNLHEAVRLESDLEYAIADAGVLVIVTPSQTIAPLARRLSKLLASDAHQPVLLLASKGIDLETLAPLSDVLERELPDFSVAVVSGPCIAREVAQNIPTSVVAASSDINCARAMRDMVATNTLRVYTQSDLLGVELGGALKNIIAIAAGIGDGLGYGANSKSALITRGLAEMARLATAMGAKPTTIYGLAGLGDLAVTCFSPHSRNRTFGEHLGRGLTPEEARQTIGMIVEGEPTARAALRLAERLGVDLPISEVVVRVCDGEINGHEAVEFLMQRELKDEFGAR